MDDKPFIEGVKEAFREFRKNADKNSVAVGIVVGVAATLGLGMLLPDTARSFVEEARGRTQKHRHKSSRRIKAEGEKQLAADMLAQEVPSFTAKLEDGRASSSADISK